MEAMAEPFRGRKQLTLQGLASLGWGAISIGRASLAGATGGCRVILTTPTNRRPGSADRSRLGVRRGLAALLGWGVCGEIVDRHAPSPIYKRGEQSSVGQTIDESWHTAATIVN